VAGSSPSWSLDATIIYLTNTKHNILGNYTQHNVSCARFNERIMTINFFTGGM